MRRLVEAKISFLVACFEWARNSGLLQVVGAGRPASGRCDLPPADPFGKMMLIHLHLRKKRSGPHPRLPGALRTAAAIETRHPLASGRAGGESIALSDDRFHGGRTTRCADCRTPPGYTSRMGEPTQQPPSDPVTEAYKKDVDRTLLRENLKLTVEARILKLMQLQRLVMEVRRAGREAFGKGPTTRSADAFEPGRRRVHRGRRAGGDRAGLGPCHRRRRHRLLTVEGQHQQARFRARATVQRGLNFTLVTSVGDIDVLGEIIGDGTYERLEERTKARS